MLTVALTGGIGSGKSTVADLFQKLNVPIIDADVIAKDIASHHAEVLKKMIAHFGVVILDSDGNLNRQALRELIFKDPAERLWLEQLLHPIIVHRIESQLEKLQAEYCIVVIPLINYAHQFNFIDRILVVDSDEQQQINRTQVRDQVDSDLVQAIMSSQISRQQRLELADDVIDNTGDIDKLHQQVQTLHQYYKTL